MRRIDNMLPSEVSPNIPRPHWARGYGAFTHDNGLNASVLLNASAIPDNYKDTSKNKITNPFGGELKVDAPANNTQYGYQLTLTELPKSACISLGTLNLGTSTAGYAISNNGTPTFPTGSQNKGPISPADAATKCSGDSHSPFTAW